MYLYDGKGTYKLPIHSEDSMLAGFTYQEIMDIAGANYGYPLTEEKLKRTINSMVAVRIDDMWENWELCKGKMIES